MVKKMKKILSILIAAAMSAGIFSIPAIAASSTFAVTEGDIPAENPNTAPVQLETGIQGMTLTIGADTWTYKADAQSDDSGISYVGRIYGQNNPNPQSGKGTYYQFDFDDTVEDGRLSVFGQIAAAKPLYVLDNGTAMDEYNGITVDGKSNITCTFNVQANHIYTVYTSGSKMGLFGCTYTVSNPQAEFAEEIAGLTFSVIAGGNVDENNVEENLELIQSYESAFGSCDVRWETSDSTVIANDGTVNAQKTDTTVTLTGIFSVQENDALVAKKTFTVTVLADPDDESAVKNAAEALTIGDTSSVKKDITLPTSGKKGTAISWKSSDDSVVTTDGVVRRYPGEDKTVILTAEISRGEAKLTKEFTVTVAGYIPITYYGCSYADADGNVRYTPSDGGTLKSITVSCSIKDAGDNDIMAAAVYDTEGILKNVKIINLSELMYDECQSVELNLPMNGTDVFKLISIAADTVKPYGSCIKPAEPSIDNAKIYVVGDSTASVYDDKNYPRKGWAQMLGNYFDRVEVVDYALSGRSSVNFKNEANYTKLKNEIKPGDYLIVQFGHNDSKADDLSRYSDPSGDRFTDGSYKKSMYEYIELARDKGAIPVIATSISRRSLSDSTLEKYVSAAKELAKELDVPCIDLYAATNGYINEVGEEAAKDMFNYVKPYDSRFISYAGFANSGFYTTGTTDNTHINIYGADIISQWTADAMKNMGLHITKKMNDYRAVYPLPSYAAAESITP